MEKEACVGVNRLGDLGRQDLESTQHKSFRA